MGTFRDPRFYLALGAVLYLGFALPLIPLGADDVRMVDVFSADEALAVAVVRHLHGAGTLALDMFSYGGLFYYLPLLVLKLWGMLGQVGDRAVIVAMRGLCTVAGAGCLWLTYRVGCAVFGRVAGLGGMFLLLVTPEFLRWAVEIHPDLPQLFWMLGALLYCCRLCRSFDMNEVVLASLFAGLAAGTKYGGVFLLPVIVLSVLLPADGRLSLRAGLQRLSQGEYLLALGLVPAVFLLAFALTNPYAFIRFDRFWADLSFEREHLSFGHMFRADRVGLGWVTGLVGLTGYAGGLCFAAYAALAVVRRRGRIPADRAMLLIWVAGYTGYLVLTTNFQAMRHLLPVLPPVLLFAGEACRVAWEWMAARLGRRPATFAALPVLLAVLLGKNAADATELFRHRWGRVDARPEIAAGRWLGATFPAETSMLFDAYSYVPERFGRVFRTFGQSYPLAAHFQPDLLVVRDAIAGRYGNLEDAGRFQEGEDEFLDRHYFYSYLKEGRIPAYRLLKDFGGVAVYERVSEEAEAARSVNWMERVRLFASGRVYGLPGARQTMGDIHASLGQWEAAAREYRLLTELVPGHGLAHYKLARMYLELQRLDEAKQAFEGALETVASRPADYRASVRHNMARQYFEAGFYGEAAAEAQEALRLNPALEAAYYDLGVFYLVKGDMERAEAAYAEAVRRFGADAEAAGRLRSLVRQGARVAEAERILRVYFGEGGRQ